MCAMSLWSKGDAARSLEKHARRVAGAMSISRADARVLCDEVRNALCGVTSILDPGIVVEPQDRELAETAVDRIVALLFAIEAHAEQLERPRRAVRAPARARRKPGRP